MAIHRVFEFLVFIQSRAFEFTMHCHRRRWCLGGSDFMDQVEDGLTLKDLVQISKAGVAKRLVKDLPT